MTRLATNCRHCGTAIRPDDPLCPGCLRNVDAAPATPSRKPVFTPAPPASVPGTPCRADGCPGVLPRGAPACPRCETPASPEIDRGSAPSDGGDRSDRDEKERDEELLPLPLREDFRFVRHLSIQSGQAEVLLCEQLSTGASAVVKLYGESRVQEQEALAQRLDILRRLRTADPDFTYTTRPLVEPGIWRGRRYEVEEYCEAGSLADLLEMSPDGLPARMVREILSQLAAALEVIHGTADVLHLDVKPSNVLRRSDDPLTLVLTDFGLALALDGRSQILADVAGTAGYMPPEGDISSPARDWWALGVSVLELLTGKHPFRPDGTWLSPYRIMASVATKPVPLDRVRSPRWRSLFAGLLTRDTEHRWCGEQVRSWLAGEAVSVHADEPQQVSHRIESHIRPFPFCGRRYINPGEFARHAAAEWEEAKNQIFRNRSLFQEWLAQFNPPAGLTNQLAKISDGEHKRTNLPAAELSPIQDRYLATLIATLAPDVGPVFRGMSMDRANLLTLARSAAGADNQNRKLICALLESRTLSAFAALDHYADYALLDTEWQEMYISYVNRMRILRTAAAKAPHTVAADFPGDELDAGTAEGIILAALLDENFRDRLAAQTRTELVKDAIQIPWYRTELQETVLPGIVHDLLVSVTAPIAAQQWDRIEREAKQKRRAEALAKREARRATQEVRHKKWAQGIIWCCTPGVFFAAVTGIFLLTLSAMLEKNDYSTAYAGWVKSSPGWAREWLASWPTLDPTPKSDPVMQRLGISTWDPLAIRNGGIALLIAVGVATVGMIVSAKRSPALPGALAAVPAGLIGFIFLGFYLPLYTVGAFWIGYGLVIIIGILLALGLMIFFFALGA